MAAPAGTGRGSTHTVGSRNSSPQTLKSLIQIRHQSSLLERVDNPFENHAAWTSYEIFKAVVVGCTLFPIRLIAFIVFWIIATLIAMAAVAGGGTTLVNDRGCLRHEKPLAAWRRAILWPLTLAFRIILWGMGYWHIKVTDHRTPFTRHEVRLRHGKDYDIVKHEMTIAEAMVKVKQLKGCQGFAVVGQDVEDQTPRTNVKVTIIFVSKFELEPGTAGTAYCISPKPNIIVCAPHMSPFDAMILAYCFPPLPSEVGKIDLVQGVMGKLLGSMAIASQGIFVDREAKESRQACKEAISARAHPSWTGAPTLIFPEGTTTNGCALINFKPGAFMPGQPVTPVALKYPYKYLNLGWTGDFAYSLPSLILRGMLQFANFCEVEIFEPYVPSPAEIDNCKLYAENVRMLIATALGVPTTEHSYADASFSLKALKANVDSDFTVDDATRRYGINAEQLLEWLAEFKKYDADRSGYISFDEFQKVMAEQKNSAMQNSEVLERLFHLFNTDQTGHLSYREFIQALSVLSDRSLEGGRKLCFLLCAPREDGKLPRALLQNALEAAWEGDVDSPSSGRLRVSLSHLPEEVDYKTFCLLADQYPQLMEATMRLMPEKFVPESVRESNRLRAASGGQR